MFPDWRKRKPRASRDRPVEAKAARCPSRLNDSCPVLFSRPLSDTFTMFFCYFSPAKRLMSGYIMQSRGRACIYLPPGKRLHQWVYQRSSVSGLRLRQSRLKIRPFLTKYITLTSRVLLEHQTLVSPCQGLQSRRKIANVSIMPNCSIMWLNPAMKLNPAIAEQKERHRLALRTRLRP